MEWTTVASWLFLAVSLWGAWFTYNAYRPTVEHQRLSVLSFFAGWLTTELALHHIAWQAVATAVFVWFGALEAWPGRIGFVITLGSWAGLVGCLVNARRAERVLEEALEGGLGDDYLQSLDPESRENLTPAVTWKDILLPFPIRRSGVERVRNIIYARERGIDLGLDVWVAGDRPKNAPVLLQIHGGAWVLGSKNEQGLPLMQMLASRGWVCVSADYRLSPHATFPDHLIDLKKAIAWIRENIADYGGDPNTLFVTGGSAGGHLCSLVALTAGDPRYQPGFEDVDTSVAGCVSFYGVYDFADHQRVWKHPGLVELLERQVMKASREEDPAAWDEASPIFRITEDAPPFLVIHGTNDTLVPVQAARNFVERFRERARAPIVYAEIPGAQHAFEIFPSLRTSLVLHGVERFLCWVLSHRGAQARDEVGGPADQEDAQARA